MVSTRLTLIAGVVATIALASCGAGGGTGASGGGDPRTLRIAHNSNAAALPVRVAEAKGIFAKHNLKVQLTKVENLGTLPGAVGKSFDVALSVPTTLITAAQQGIPVAQVAGATVDIEQNPTAFLIGSRKAGVSKPKDLEGKTLGVLVETGTTHVATKAWLKHEGVDLSAVKIVQVDGPAQADQLSSGRIDAVETVMPFATNILRNPDAADLGDPYLKLAPELSAILWIAQRDFASKQPEVIKDFRAALDEAQTFIAQNDKEARQVLKDYTGLPDAVIAGTKLPTYTSEVRSEDLQVWLDTMREVDNFKTDMDLKTLVARQN
ncbi:ABC transporter substrate-binding protein [Kibdelosporangium philippinense]|uniref:ABC transporter substrate-binding protein n=1 Tax=Kibdelosporangium philippinense TaxID=211113 RepID=A0ABS8ZXZ7_9PSEU|nr:ABC transporter substrate-binding protein [Kibdelosporangium philippinense]MCE7010887.1 ABC transporter substrate-binding protein [Kibdelosporangium philippinense]